MNIVEKTKEDLSILKERITFLAKNLGEDKTSIDKVLTNRDLEFLLEMRSKNEKVFQETIYKKLGYSSEICLAEIVHVIIEYLENNDINTDLLIKIITSLKHSN